MKIKTITCHDVYNLGASLQAYALTKYLTILGHDAKIIDYKPDYLIHYKLFNKASGRYDYPVIRQIYHLAKLPGNIGARHGRRKKEFDEFTAKYLPLTEKTYSSNEELKLCPPSADVYFAGSDQIWNTVFPNGWDPAFYLDFVRDDAVKASYAASFATETIKKDAERNVKQWLSKLDFISVRESSGVRIVQELGMNAVQVLDPVFLLDKSVWLNVEKSRKIDRPYILFYDFDNNDKMCDFVLKQAKKNNCRIYSLLPSKIADRCFSEEGPAAFIYLIRNAELIVSNSFHATAFSVIFNKPFFVFNRNEHINTRMRDLLDSLGLSDRLIDDPDSAFGPGIDYSQVNQKLSEQILHSKKYIDKILESVSRRHEKDSVCD